MYLTKLRLALSGFVLRSWLGRVQAPETTVDELILLSEEMSQFLHPFVICAQVGKKIEAR